MPPLCSRLFAAAAFAASFAATGVIAETIPFSGWSSQRFALFSSVNFSQGGTALSISSDRAASLIYRAAPDWSARRASWSWAVSQSVPATDLTVKGGDDRNIALYFVFLPRADAEALRGASVTRLLRHPNVRALVYVWGGSHSAGARIGSPYLGAKGQTIVLRPAGTGQAQENVDLDADFRRAFGGAPGALVGLAVSADSDDTGSQIRAQVSRLSLN